MGRIDTAAFASGALVTISIFLFFDALIIAGREHDPHLHFTFVTSLPFMMSLLGFFVINFTTPLRVASGATDALVLAFTGWMLLFASTSLALVQCYIHYVGVPRLASSPGVCLVLQTCAMAMACTLIWCRSHGATTEQTTW